MASDDAWSSKVFMQWPFKHHEFPNFSLMYICNPNIVDLLVTDVVVRSIDWPSKPLQAFICIGHLRVLNSLGFVL